MEIVILTALGVGGATVFGASFGLIFRKTGKVFNDLAMSLAAGVMLAAAVLGLILPSLEYGGRFAVIITVSGIFVGALCVNLLDFLMLSAFDTHFAENKSAPSERVRRVILFVSAISIHNLPEGIAAGVGFGGENISDGIFIATAIALQNIPEGIAVVVAMLGIGIKSYRSFLIAALTGLVEIIGTVIGYFAVNISLGFLPFMLAFAGGNMLYVIADEMIPDTRSEGGPITTYLVLLGFSLMLILNEII